MATNVKVNSAVARTVRTGIQGGPAWALVEGIDAFFYDFNDRQFGIAVVLLTMLLAFVQNSIENGIGKALLRTPQPTNELIGEAK